MDQNRIDGLARLFAGGLDSRRSFVGLLAGSMISSVATRFGVTEVVAAKKTSHKRKHDAGRKEAHTERKRSKKHGNKQRKKRKQEEYPLCSLTCEAHGGRCCPGGVCVDARTCCDGTPPCPDGSCPGAGECCEGLWMCPGDVCHPVDQCCPGLKRCGETTCVPEHQCCDDEQACPGGTCVPLGSCCPNQRQCGPSTCVAADTCCDDEVRCDDGACVPLGQCCPGTKPCNGRCVSEDICCTSAPRPTCETVWRSFCCHDKWVCQEYWDTPSCEPFDWLKWNPDTCDCGCPDGSVYNHESGQNPVCCPSSHPRIIVGNICGIEGETIICPIGFSVCELGPGQWNCCPSSTVSSPQPPASANAHDSTASAHGQTASDAHQERKSSAGADHAARAAHGARKRDRGKARRR